MTDTDKPQPDEKPATQVVQQADAPEAEGTGEAGSHTDTRSRSLLKEIAAGDALSGALAVLLAVFVGSVMIAATDQGVRDAASYITARPSDFFTALWDAISGAYSAMFRGAIFNYNLTDPAQQWRPLTETLKFS